MHLLRAEAERICRALRTGVARISGDARDNPHLPEVVLFPGFTLLRTAAEALATGDPPIAVGGQDVSVHEQGAFTGETAAAQLLDAGAAWVLCGHSERRAFHGESDALVAAKAAAAVAAGLRPIVCVGETADERRSGKTFSVLDRQISVLSDLPGLVVAYEPVWAIGTGETATPEIAQEAHEHLRGRCNELFSAAGEKLRILYGGSVTPDNSMGLARMPDIDGALVGGASLDPERFLAIISSFAASRGLSRTSP